MYMGETDRSNIGDTGIRRRKMVVWGIRPPFPPDPLEMAETLKFQAKVFKYEMR